MAAVPFHVNVRLFDPLECRLFLRKHFYEGILCAGDSLHYDEDPCRGDSGGPLICNDELTGIISWTTGCGTDRLPSLYTDVWHNREWIEKHLSRASFNGKGNYFILILVIIFFI